MTTPFNFDFHHITDPVQRNSFRQQWSQMLNAGLSNADLRILLDKYPDFRFAVQELVRNLITDEKYLDYPEKLKEYATIFPEFKSLVDQQIKALSELKRRREEERESYRRKLSAFNEEQVRFWNDQIYNTWTGY